MNWNNPILTDSGGFQIMSLSKLNKIDKKKGAYFSSHIDGKKFLLSPEKSIEIQQAINSDIMMVLDECPKLTNDKKIISDAIDTSTHWAERSKIALNISRGSYQKMYSSDRLSSLMGNGLLVFLENKTGLTKMFKNNKDAVFFKTKVDLVKKINFFLKNDKLRKNIARSGCIKYHKKYSNLHVARYILSKLKLNNHKISWFK